MARAPLPTRILLKSWARMVNDRLGRGADWPTGRANARPRLTANRSAGLLKACHARACPGHPRPYSGDSKKDVDGRVKPGHDGCISGQALRMRPVVG